MEPIEMGAMVGPGGNIRVTAVAETHRPGIRVFIGADTTRDQYVVSTFETGENWWHSGYYTNSMEKALAAFVGKIDDTLTVFAP